MSRRARITPEDAHETFTSLKSLLAPIDEPISDAAESKPIEVELGRVRPNPQQPRRDGSPGFSTSSIEELAENIKQHGILQPLLVKDTGRFYQIVAGERRYRAAQMIGLETLPVRVIEPRDEQDELQIALAENLQRKNLDTLEEALAFRTLIHRFGLSYRDLARLSGRSVAHVHGRLQLLEYGDVRDAVEGKRIGVADAIQLARVPDEAQRRELLAAVQDGALRGSALHRRVQVFLGELSPESLSAQETAATPPAPEPDLDTALAVVQRLGDDLDDDQRSTLRTLAECAAERLHLQLTAPQELAPEPEPPTAPAPEAPRVPQPMDAQARRAVSRAKEFRSARGYTITNLIQVYWRTMQRRGYDFAPGDWSATPAGDGRYLVSFSYRVDNEARAMEWMQDADGVITPANEDARHLTE